MMNFKPNKQSLNYLLIFLKKPLTFCLFIAAALISCEKENFDADPITDTDLTNTDILRELGYNPDLAEPYSYDFQGKTIEGFKILDQFVDNRTLQDIKSNIGKEETEKIYVRNSRVNPYIGRSNNGVRTIVLSIAGSNDLQGRPINQNREIRIAREVANYFNGFNFKIRFEVVTRNNNFDTRVFILNGRDGLGASPRGGNPGNRIEVGRNVSNQQFRGQLLHEMMHTIGFRHSDFRTRRSCAGVNPSQVFDENGGCCPIDQVYIPGTDVNGNTLNSVVTACYVGNFNLTVEDWVALNHIYRR